VRDQAECHRADTVADIRCATGVRRRGRPRPPRRRNLIVIPTLSLPVQSAAQGERPVIGSVEHAGSAKPRIGRNAGSSVGGSRTSAEGLRCLATSAKGELDSCAQIPRIGSEGPWPAASVDFTKREGRGREGDVHDHPVIAMEPERHHPLSLALSCWLRQNRRRWPHIATAVLQDINPQRGSRSEDAGEGSQAVDA
jgi:hypothetical protein